MVCHSLWSMETDSDMLELKNNLNFKFIKSYQVMDMSSTDILPNIAFRFYWYNIPLMWKDSFVFVKSTWLKVFGIRSLTVLKVDLVPTHKFVLGSGVWYVLEKCHSSWCLICILYRDSYTLKCSCFTVHRKYLQAPTTQLTCLDGIVKVLNYR